MSVWYVKSGSYAALTGWAASTAYTVGQIRKMTATPPNTGDFRAFICGVAGTSGGTEPVWTTTKRAANTDNTVTWYECTGTAALNGDVTNTPPFVASTAYTAGQIIKNIAATHYFLCTTAGTTAGSEPAWSTTTGNATTSGTATFKCIGAVGAFSAWGCAFRDLADSNASCLTGGINANAVPGDTIYVSSSHNSTNAGTLGSIGNNPGTALLPTLILSVNDATAPPTALLAGAVQGWTASGVSFSNFAQFYMYGVELDLGTGANNATIQFNSSGLSEQYDVRLDTCILKLNTTNTSARMVFGSSGSNESPSYLRLTNTKLRFGATAQGINVGSINCDMFGGSIADTGTVPTALIVQARGFPNLNLRGVDMTNLNTALHTGPLGQVSMAGCKINASLVSTTALNNVAWHLRMMDCDSAATNYKMYINTPWGSIQQETTTVLTGGASDGTTPISWKFVSLSTASFSEWVEGDDIIIWNDTVGSSVTATVNIAGASALTDGDIWFDIFYLGSAASPLDSIASTRKAGILTAGSTLTSSGASWGGSPASKQSMAVSFTPQQKGPLAIRVCLAKPSTTVYVDPLVTLT